MAVDLSKYGWGAAATYAKPKPKPAGSQVKAVGAVDPFGAIMSGQVTNPTDVSRLIGMIQPDYSGVPKIDLNALHDTAHQQAVDQLSPYKAALDDQYARTQAQQEKSQAAAQAFTAALTEMLQGGQTGQAGMDYAKANYGGSYLGAIAGAEGTQLFAQITAGFNDQLNEITSKISDLMAKSPEIEQDIYDSLAKSADEMQKNGIDMANADVQTKVKAAAVILKQANDDRKAMTALVKAMGKGGKGQFVYAKDGTILWGDPATGQVSPVYKSATPDGKVQWKTSGGQVITRNPDGSYTFTKVPGALTPEEKAAAARNKPPKPPAASPVIGRAQIAGKNALELVLNNIWKQSGMPPQQIEVIQNGKKVKVANPKYAEAQQWYHDQLPRSFRTAMTRVSRALTYQLKILKWPPGKIQRMAYEIVSAEIPAPDNYTPPPVA